MTWDRIWPLLWEGLGDTLYMIFPSTVISYIIGLPLGILLVITEKGHIRPHPTLNTAAGIIVNFLRSIPFIILLAMLIPVTREIMGTAIGTKGVLFPLIISAFPYVARMVEGSIKEVDRGTIEAAESMGSTTWQIIYKVLIPEARPSLINGAAITIVAIIGYTAMAHVVGGGGLGAVAITQGYNRGKKFYNVMYAASIALVILVQIVSVCGTLLTRKTDHRLR